MLQRTIEKFQNFKVIELYNSGYSLNQLQSIIGSSKSQIRGYLLANNIKIRGSKKNFTPQYNTLCGSKSGKRFNDRIFEKIDTEEKAYWLGFFYADGYVIEKGNIVGITLQAKDVEHLHKFNRFVEMTENNVKYHPKKTKERIYDLYRWEIGNFNLYQSLVKNGCVPRKSLILKFPNETILPKNLIKHFIRGYFDGDGCVCLTNKTREISILGTAEMLNEIKNITGIFKQKVNKPKNKNIYQLNQFNENAFNFLKYIYEDATIYLNRKYEKYLEFCRLYEESYKVLEDKNEEICDDNLVLTDEDYE